MSVETAEKMNVVPVLYFGRPEKAFVLDALEWNNGHHELIRSQLADETLSLIRLQAPPIIVIDFDQPHFNPLHFMEQLPEAAPGERSVFGVTAAHDKDMVAASIKRGVDYVYHMDDEPGILQRKISHLIYQHINAKQEQALYEKERQRHDFRHIVGESLAMQTVFNLIQRITQRKWVSVLILGETGTGKELIARAIHYKSCSQKQPFVAVNCNALPENLLESELFGFEKGAFTDAKTQRKGMFELAQNGTLLLDEIGDISPVLQVKLLRVIENKTVRRLGGEKDIHVNTRIIAATNKNLQQAIRDGQFRKDLYYRLNVLTLTLPPLREREEDILILARHFLKHYAHEYESPLVAFSAQAEKLLMQYHWPGNVRELKHTIERLALLCDGCTVERKHVEEAIEWEIELIKHVDAQVSTDVFQLPPEGMSLEDGEKMLIAATLEREGWNKRRSAELLKISRPRLDRKIERFGLKPQWEC